MRWRRVGEEEGGSIKLLTDLDCGGGIICM